MLTGVDACPTAGPGLSLYFAKMSRSGSRKVQDRTVVFYDPRGRGNSGPVADKTQVTSPGYAGHRGPDEGTAGGSRRGIEGLA